MAQSSTSVEQCRKRERGRPDVSSAIEEFLLLTDQGLTDDAVRDFLARCGKHGEEYLAAVKLRLRLFSKTRNVINEVDRETTRT